jgi:hypothetical protein
MPGKSERLARLSARIDRDGWLQLNRMRHHPNFDELLEFLEAIPGTVTPTHIESATQHYIDGREDTQ